MLDDEAIERYARQIVIPGVGASGQEKLLRSTALVMGDARGCRAASVYLRAAGVHVVSSTDAVPARIDVVVVTDAPALDESTRERLASAGRPVCWSATDEGGLRSGVHPAAALPRSSDRPARADPSRDAAGCDVAALACCVLLGWDLADESFLAS